MENGRIFQLQTILFPTRRFLILLGVTPVPRQLDRAEMSGNSTPESEQGVDTAVRGPVPRSAPRSSAELAWRFSRRTTLRRLSFMAASYDNII